MTLCQKHFSSYVRHKLKIWAITLQILNQSTRNYPGAQLDVLTNIPIKSFMTLGQAFYELRAIQKKTNGWMDGWTDGQG
jgi:hypothetical protein